MSRTPAHSDVPPPAPFLFSVDLEDIRSMFPGGERHAERVPHNTRRYLDFLDRHGLRCTFFTVGDVARRYPGLVGEILARGHEVACHSSDHVTLDRHDPASFRADIERCLEDLGRAGVARVHGFRAPAASLNRESEWAYPILEALGFTYSSSVLASGVRHGWSDFGDDRPRRMGGLWEIPLSLMRLPRFDLPFCGGIFFRVLPFPLVRHFFRRRLAGGEPVVAYFHPYDVDHEQERFMHPQIDDSRFYNWLMYRNRDRVLPRLEALVAEGAPVLPYAEYVQGWLEAPAGGPPHAGRAALG